MSEMRKAKTSELIRRDLSVRGLANWILDYADVLRADITNMALNKLIFFIYEESLIGNSEIVTNAKVEAWEHGPVFREIYQDFKGYGDRPIDGRAKFFSIETKKVEIVSLVLDKETELRFRKILDPLIFLPASRLRNLSHAEGGAWDRVWSYEGRSNPGMEIKPEIILDVASSRGVAVA